uniref:Solute carrier family 35 member C2 (inferred by orthology to a human protein) n=1 Tax=Strongyloides venezuelensis TaxID=75913 RepID=A0A0K0G2N9_STRVS
MSIVRNQRNRYIYIFIFGEDRKKGLNSIGTFFGVSIRKEYFAYNLKIVTITHGVGIIIFRKILYFVNMMQLFLVALLYYLLSIGLTFFQKQFIKTFHFPLFIVAGHYFTKLVVGYISRIFLEWKRGGKKVRLPIKDQLYYLLPIGVCASFDIGLSNWALEYVTVSLYTMAKSSSILFIFLFSILLNLERWRTSLAVSSGLIAFGLFLFTWRSNQLDILGLVLVELAALCTGIRWTVSQLIMQQEESPTTIKNPIDMIVHVQPWMILAILPLAWIFEGNDIQSYNHPDITLPMVFVNIFFGGLLAFSMEVTEYALLLKTSGITLNILGIIKELITLLLAHYIHHDKLTTINGAGLILCITGMILHALTKQKKNIHLNRIGNASTNGEDEKRLLMSEVCENA